MDLSTTIIGLALLALCISPILYFEIIKNTKRKKAAKAFLASVEKRGLTVSDMDLWNNSAIGIDVDSQTLYYRNLKKEQDITVDLSKIKKCRVIRVMREEEGTGGNRNILDRIHLGLSESGQGKETLLEFYGPDDSMTVSDELRLAEKWSYVISSRIKGR